MQRTEYMVYLELREYHYAVTTCMYMARLLVTYNWPFNASSTWQFACAKSYSASCGAGTFIYSDDRWCVTKRFSGHASQITVAVTLQWPQSSVTRRGTPNDRLTRGFITHKTIMNVNDIFAINHSDQQPCAERTWRRSAGSGSTERFFLFGSRKGRHGGLTDTRNFFGLIRIVAGHWVPCKRVRFRKFLHFCDHFPLFSLNFYFPSDKRRSIFFATDGQEFWSWVFSKELLCYFYSVCCVCSIGYFMYTPIRSGQSCATTRLKKRNSNQRKKRKTGRSNGATAQAWLSSATSTISCCV